MLVDINANVGHWPFQQLQYNTCEGLLGRMDRFGVDVSVVSNLNGVFYKNTQSANEELYKELASNKSFASRFIAFAVINPLYATCKEDLKVCRDKMGMKGVRLYPKYHDYELTNPACVELVKYARDLGMPVSLTLRMVDKRQRSWMDIEQEWALKDILPIIKAVPDATYMILNVANSIQLAENESALFKRSNVLMDTSGRTFNNLADALAKFGKDKFAFGTHAPIHDYLTGLLRIEALTDDEVDNQTKGLLRFGNASKMLHI